MTLVAKCVCGKRYQAPDKLAGKTLPCPACGKSIAVPAPAAAMMSELIELPQVGDPIVVSCRCGKRFQAPPSWEGRRTACPSCRVPIAVTRAPARAEEEFVMAELVDEGPADLFSAGTSPSAAAWDLGGGRGVPMASPANGARTNGPPAYVGQAASGGRSFFENPRIVPVAIGVGVAALVVLLAAIFLPPAYRAVREAVASRTAPAEAPAPVVSSPPSPFVVAAPAPPAFAPPAFAPPAFAPPAPAPPDSDPSNPFVPTTAPAVSEPVDLGEPTLPADGAPVDAPIVAAATLPLYRLTGVRIGQGGRNPYPKLIVAWERIRGDDRSTGPMMVIRSPDGAERKLPDVFFLPGSGRAKSGELYVDIGSRFGPRDAAVPQNLEVFFVRRWSFPDFTPSFKVSNSCVMGDLGRAPHYAREWKPTEAARIQSVLAEKK